MYAEEMYITTEDPRYKTVFVTKDFALISNSPL